MTLTPSETETIKMFDEKFVKTECSDDTCYSLLEYFSEDCNPKDVKAFWLSQIRLARADERKQAYEDGKNAAVDYIEKNLIWGKVAMLEFPKYHSSILESARKA